MLPRLLLSLLLASAAGATGPERDDPAARRAAMRRWEGEQGGAASFRALQAARLETNRDGPLRPSAVPGSVFVNLGPAREDFAFNGATYATTDSGRVRQILPHPANPDILYLATAGGGVWKTWDGGAGWEPLGDKLGALSVGALAMDPASPEILYLGLGDPFGTAQAGLVRSRDGGATWSDPVLLTAVYDYGGTTYRLPVDRISDIKVDPLHSANLFVATNRGFFRSTDGGQSFLQIPLVGAAPGDLYFQMWSIAWVAPNTWLATGTRKDLTGRPAPGDLGFWRSVDNGVNWTWNAAALPASGADLQSIGRGTLATAPSTVGDAASARVFLLAGTSPPAGPNQTYAQKDLYRSEDGGRTFVSLRMNGSRLPLNPTDSQNDLDVLHEQSWYNQAIAVDPRNPDLVFVGGNLALVRSSDGGQSWSVVSDWLPAATRVPLTYLHADLHALAIGPTGVFYAGSDGGLFRSKDDGTSVRSAPPASVRFEPTMNQGLVTHLVYDLACAPESWPSGLQGFVVGGLQDNGTRLRSGTTTTFNQVYGGDGVGVAVSGDATSTAPATLLASVPGKILRTVDGGANWAEFVAGLQYELPFLVRLQRDAAAAGPATFLTFTGVARTASGTVLQGSVFRTVSGADWTDVGRLLHWQTGETTQGFLAPTGAAIELRNLGTHSAASVWGAVSNKFAYVTANGGADWTVSKQPALPGAAAGAILLSSIAFDPSDPSGRSFYLTSRTMLLDDGTPLPKEMGRLYATADGGATWSFLTAGLPDVPFEIVRVDPGDPSTLYVGTDAGLYRSTDRGKSFQRFGGESLPLVRVTDLCISPQSRRLTVSTFGRGFWQIDTAADGDPAGVKGNGDTNFDQRLDGFDLMDLADALGATQASDRYRAQADLVGATNLVDDADLAAFLLRFGGSP